MTTNGKPDWWECTKLADISCKLVDGSHNPPKKQAVGLPMLSALNINDHKIAFSSYRLISEEDFRLENQRTRIAAGDVLLTIVGAIGRAAVVPDSFAPFTLQRSVAVITPILVEPKFLMYQLAAPRVALYFEKNARGTAQKGVYLKTLGRTEIWLPPINEQRRIVAKIEELFSELDKGIESLKTAREQLKVYRQALLKHAFEGKLTAAWRAENPDKLEIVESLLERLRTEREQRYEQQLVDWQNSVRQWEAGGSGERKPSKPSKLKEIPPLTVEELTDLPQLPDGWMWVWLGQLTWSVKDGPHYSPQYVENGIPFISGGNIRPDGVDFDSAKFISEELHRELSKRCKPEIGDILYTKGGTTGIARVNTYSIDFNVWVHVAVLKLIGWVEPFFIQHALNSPFCYAQAQRYTHGVGNQDLGLTRMVNILLPVCSPGEQAAVIEAIDRHLSEIHQAESTVAIALQQSEALRQSILKKAFSGQLVPQDPDDEPASVLLERIRAEVSVQWVGEA